MQKAKQLAPDLGPIAVRASNAVSGVLADAAAGAEEFAAEALPEVTLGALELAGAYADTRELIAALQGKCH